MARAIVLGRTSEGQSSRLHPDGLAFLIVRLFGNRRRSGRVGPVWFDRLSRLRHWRMFLVLAGMDHGGSLVFWR
jgi:hypothetical protein